MSGCDFRNITIGKMFHINGNDYVKQSTRTGRMLSNGKVFYFAQSEYVFPVAW